MVKKKKGFTLLELLIVLLIFVSILSLGSGSVGIPFKKVFALLFSSGSTLEHTILFNIRLPRIVLAVICGGGLSIAGVILQALFRNPLVEPYTLGVSGGAALLVAIFIVLGWTGVLPLAGFIGANIAVFLVYLITSRRGNWNVNAVLLTGVMFGFISSSLIMLIMALSRVHELRSIIFWIMGSLEVTQWNIVGVISGIVILGLLISYLFSNDLNALLLGEEEAIHLGINVDFTKRILFLLASLIAGCIVSVSGIIGFVGLVIPHFMRMIVGKDHRILLPASFLGGSIFLLISDTLSRTIISPRELPVGVITGIFGGIVFIYFLYKRPLI